MDRDGRPRGSIAFMAAALFGFSMPSTASPEWLWGANRLTLIGAACLWLASHLLIPELFGPDTKSGAGADS